MGERVDQIRTAWMRLLSGARVCFCVLSLVLAFSFSAWAQAVSDTAGPAQISADELTHDEALNIVTARGNVEVVHGEMVLKANTMTYNVGADIISASGDVSLLQPDKSVLFAEFFEIHGDLKVGIAKNIRLLLADQQSRLAAQSAERTDGNTTVLKDASYTPCLPCKDNPDKVLWQLKSVKVVHDQAARKVSYENAWLEFMDVPVAYTPYLSHPDPTVKRESGFLVPSFGSNRSLGANVSTPYFWAIDEFSDATITPTITANERAVLSGEYRKNYTRGDLKTTMSGTVDSQERHRGHIMGKGTYEHDPNWRSTLDLQRTTDDTYMRRYGFGNLPYLTTHGATEGFSGNSYASAEFFNFQGLTTSHDPGTTPMVLPLLGYNYVGDPSRQGGRMTFDASGLALSRDQGAESQRVSTEFGWNRPYTSKFGEVYNFRASLRGDAYHMTDQPLNNGTFNGNATRVLPQASLDWRFPMVKESGETSQVLEPIVVGVVSPYGGNPEKIANEDSRDFEFDDTNLFRANRFTGFDRVEGGPRVNYGLGWSMYAPSLGQTEVLVGQSYRPHVDSTFAPESGLEKDFSDLVGRMKYNPSENLGFNYRFRLSQQDLGARRNELGFNVGPKALNLQTTYFFVNQNPSRDPTAEFGDREEVSFVLSSAMTQYWSTQLFSRHDLAQDGGPVRTGLQAVYEDECFIFNTALIRDYTYDRDINTGVSIMFQVMFKTLGGVTSGSQMIGQ